MRKTILREGPEHAIGGNIIMPGALKWDPDKKIPIRGPGNTGLGIGYIDDIRREEGGVITAEFHFFDTYKHHAEEIDAAGWGWTIYANKVDWANKTMASKKVVDGKLVATYPDPSIPWGAKKDPNA